MKLTIVEKNLLSWTAMHIDFVMCKNKPGTAKSSPAQGSKGAKVLQNVEDFFKILNLKKTLNSDF